MKRLTLNDAIGQTLRAKIEIGEELLLRFDGGFVSLKTSYEGYEIMDYTDGSDPLARLHRFSDKLLDELHTAGFIEGHDKFEAQTERAARNEAYERNREDQLRQQYEELRERFEPK
jgi:hypothetical protein